MPKTTERRFTVIPEQYLQPAETAALFAGIFRVAVGRGLNIDVVPEVTQAEEPVGLLQTAEQAKTFALRSPQSAYVITPSVEKAGQTATLPLPPVELATEEAFFADSFPTSKTVLFVSPEQFAQFMTELQSLANQLPWNESIARFGDFPDVAVVNYIREHIVGAE